MAGIRLYRWLSTRPGIPASAGHSHAGLDRDVGGPAAAKHARRHRQAPQAMLRHDVVDISGYQENVIERIRQLQPARLEIPWIISFGEPFAIRIGEASRPAIMGGSFVAGLVAGPALIESGRGACISVSFTPSGARRFFDLPMSEIAGGMVRPRTCSGTRSRRCASGAPNGIGSGALTSLRRFSRAVCWPWPGQARPPPGPTRDCGSRTAWNESRPSRASWAGAASTWRPGSVTRSACRRRRSRR